MSRLVNAVLPPRSLLFASAVLCLGMPELAHATGQAVIESTVPGRTPFIATVDAAISGAPLASIDYVIADRPGAVSAPLTVTYSAAYLRSKGYRGSNSVSFPVFGLYAGTNNIVLALFSFTDGSYSLRYLPISTPGYTDPCAEMNVRVIDKPRTSFFDLSYSYYLLKDYCSANSPAILDTDGYFRWVGTANVGSIPAIFENNGLLVSDGGTGVKRIEMNGQVSELANFSSIHVTSTNQHNMDPGRNGVVIDVNTATDTEGVAVEFNPTTGQVLNTWDMAQILAAAMTAGGDNPSAFISPLSDWFHMNATVYDAADNTEIISSRENFVIDVDYDTPADGIKKIHWILGDTTKAWATFPSLAKYALALNGAGTLPPIGQHAISLDSKGNLLLFDDGNGSSTHVPAGITRSYSAARSYQIDTKAMRATEVFTYTPTPSIYNAFCGSVYEATPGNYLVDFPGDKNASTLILQGLNHSANLDFQIQLPEISTCGAGWNAIPIWTKPISF